MTHETYYSIIGVECPNSPRLAASSGARQLPDRRCRPTPFLSRYTFSGRRRQNRRLQDGQSNYYVDRFHPRIITWVLVIIALSVADGLFTLYHLRHGAVEINPLMDLCLSKGQGCFLAAKLCLTAVCAMILLIHQNFMKMSYIVKSLGMMYGVVITYHLLLLASQL